MVDFKTRLALAKAKLDEAKGLLTPEYIEEEEARKEEARMLAEALDVAERKQAIDLARRLDAARARLPGVALRELQIKGSSHSFVVQNPGAQAYNEWDKGINGAVMAVAMDRKPTVDRNTVSTSFAVASIVDWNGLVDFGATSENGDTLIKFLSANPAIRSDVVNVAVELAKVAAEARKSTG